MTLHMNDTELASCVGCGLCLPHCPTYRVTGEEALSPRGRIAAMRAVAWDGAPVDDAFVGFMETCVQCRGCEPACPSGVPYGHLIEAVRHDLATQDRTTPWWQRLGLRALTHHRLLLAGSTVIALAQRLRLVPKRVPIGPLPVRRGPAVQPSRRPLTATDHVAQATTWVFTGCVMDAWMRPTHRSTVRLIEATGATCSVAGRGGECCGALHQHAGLDTEAKRLARRVMSAMPGSAPIVVNSAGCGAAMKDYGRLLGSPSARAFSRRVRDVHEWLADHLDDLPPQHSTRERPTVVVQDPCHLRHVQRAQQPVRTVLGRYADLLELDDDGLCCGAGGAYSALQPELAGQIRERKLASIERARSGSPLAVVASANPGCAMHLAAAGLVVRHPVDIVAELADFDATDANDVSLPVSETAEPSDA